MAESKHINYIRPNGENPAARAANCDENNTSFREYVLDYIGEVSERGGFENQAKYGPMLPCISYCPSRIKILRIGSTNVGFRENRPWEAIKLGIMSILTAEENEGVQVKI